MRILASLALAVTALASLAGCVGTVVEGAAVGGAMYLTKPSDPPPADTADQMAEHESWCYKTMGEQVDCYAEPQDTAPGRLMNVDPPNRYPLTAKAYAQVLQDNRAAHMPPPTPIVVVDPATLPPLGMSAPLPPPVMATPVPASKPKVNKHKVRKHKVKCDPKTGVPIAATPPTPVAPPLPLVPPLAVVPLKPATALPPGTTIKP